MPSDIQLHEWVFNGYFISHFSIFPIILWLPLVLQNTLPEGVWTPKNNSKYPPRRCFSGSTTPNIVTEGVWSCRVHFPSISDARPIAPRGRAPRRSPTDSPGDGIYGFMVILYGNPKIMIHPKSSYGGFLEWGCPKMVGL